MTFKIGDKVIHGTYGLGEIIQLDQKVIAGRAGSYYVVQVNTMKIWVPVESPSPTTLRPPTPASEFEKLFSILSSPGEPLSADRLERKMQLAEKMKDGRLESVCQVIRDLVLYSRTKKMNDNDTAIMERARSFLLSEWHIALAVPVPQAETELQSILASAAGD